MSSVKVMLFLSLFSGSFVQAAPDTVIHPTPTKPLFLEESLYAKLKAKVPAPPSPGSVEQRQDEAELFLVERNRTEKQCLMAASEVLVSLDSFFGGKEGILSAEEGLKLKDFFAQVRNDGDFFIQKMKVDFPRKRPFLYLDLKPCVAREVTGAYPSGHATLARLFALILSDLYPERSVQLLKRSQEIAQHRVIVGMHHPTDIRAGQKLGGEVYGFLRGSARFKAEFSKLSK